MHRIDTIFAGTHEFAAHVMEKINSFPFLHITGVITQPDKPVGRKKIMTPPPVKVVAERLGIPVDQPTTLKGYTFEQVPQLMIVAQYGKLIPASVLVAPEFGVINTHTSLLPKYRGASPIQSALMNGDKQTGVTIMKMDVGLDTGPILHQKTIDILPDETYLDLDTRLAPLSVEALQESLPAYLFEGKEPVPQDDSIATHCKQFSREDGRIAWQDTSDAIYNRYRGLSPWPGIWTTWENKRLKLLQILPSEKHVSAGKVLIEHDTIYIGTADHSIIAQKVQLEGKAAMTATEFSTGYGKRINGATLI